MNIINNMKEAFLMNINNRTSFITQLVAIFVTLYAYVKYSHRLQYYYNTLFGRIILVLIIIFSCNYRYMFVTITLIVCMFFISFKTYEGFSLTDVDSISSSIKSSLPASMVSLPPNPTPQNIYDYLNKQICATGNSDIYSQIMSSPHSSDDAKTLASTGYGMNGAICKSGGIYYQKPQLIFDAFKTGCNSSSAPDKKLMDLATSVTADPNSVNIFSAPLIAIANWLSTTNSAICGAVAPAPAPVTPVSTAS
jgi:hypothetical protein